MASKMATIRPIHDDDFDSWRKLWANYCAFYNEPVPGLQTEIMWYGFVDGGSDIGGLVAVDENDAPLGFAHYVLHPHTWSNQTLCYLEDLYVTPEARGQGIGSALIQHLIDMGKAERWRRVYWHTEVGNTTARRVYDKFSPADAYVRYTVSLPATDD